MLDTVQLRILGVIMTMGTVLSYNTWLNDTQNCNSSNVFHSTVRLQFLVYLLFGDQTNSKNSRTVSPCEIHGGNCRIFYTRI